jgi:hypothetical protein
MYTRSPHFDPRGSPMLKPIDPHGSFMLRPIMVEVCSDETQQEH